MHPIKNPKIVDINADRICVRVTRKGKKFTLDGDMAVAKADTVWAQLPKTYKVLNKDGSEVQGSFLISVETIDPHHLITHYEDNRNR